MKGIHASPHYLQILILLFSSFYLLASCTASIYDAITSCRYLLSEDHDDPNETNHQYSIDCIGSSITASSYGITALLTLLGVLLAAITSTDVDILIAFVIFGILVSYTSDVYTNLHMNCVAGDTSDQNLWDDDHYDSSKEKCQILTYGAIGGTIGVIGGFIGGYYGVLMKLKPGSFYPQRPLGLLLALAGYSSIYCFNMLATALPYCHYYRHGLDQLPDLIPPKINDDLVYHQLHPLCYGYQNTSIGYGIGVFIGLLGIPVMFRYKKRGLWIILSIFMAICSTSNRFTFLGAQMSSCDSTDNLLSDLGAYNSYQQLLYTKGCQYYAHAALTSIFATTVSITAALISLLDTILHLDHDTLLIRLRRTLFFSFGFCFSLSNLFNLLPTYITDCQLYHGDLSDDSVAQASDDVVMEATCHGKLTQMIFYSLSIVACGIGIPISLIYNFPVDNDQEITIMNLDDREADAEELVHPHPYPRPRHSSEEGEGDEENEKLLLDNDERVKGNEQNRFLLKSYL
jgi:hypothetical protein